MNKELNRMLAKVLREYKEAKEKEGYLPTIELLIEELENETRNN